MKHERHTGSGFTIVEVMVAMALFGLVIAGGLVGMRRGFEVVENSRHLNRTSQILQSEIESLRTLPWAQINNLPASEDLTDKIKVQFDTSDYNAYVVTRTTDSVDGDASLKLVTVMVTYKNRQNKQVTRSYVTIFTSGGVTDYYSRTIS